MIIDKIKTHLALLWVFLFFFVCAQHSFCQSKADSVPVIKKTTDSTYLINGKVELNTKAKTIKFDAKFNKTEGLIEVVLCTKAGKTYESLITTDVSAVELQTALLLLGYRSLENKIPQNVKDFGKKKKIENADSLFLFIEWADSTGKINYNRVEDFIWVAGNKAFLKPSSWFFNGLLTDQKGDIVCDKEISLIVANYDSYAILALKTGAGIIYNQAGVHINSPGESSFFAKAGTNMVGKNIHFIIKPASKGKKKK